MTPKLRNASSGVLAAMICIFLGNSAASAQNREQKLIDEIVRKADVGEEEKGFCASTGWPNGDNFEVFKNFLENAKVGTRKTNTFKSGGCTYDVVTNVVLKNGG